MSPSVIWTWQGEAPWDPQGCQPCSTYDVVKGTLMTVCVSSVQGCVCACLCVCVKRLLTWLGRTSVLKLPYRSYTPFRSIFFLVWIHNCLRSVHIHVGSRKPAVAGRWCFWRSSAIHQPLWLISIYDEMNRSARCNTARHAICYHFNNQHQLQIVVL